MRLVVRRRSPFGRAPRAIRELGRGRQVDGNAVPFLNPLVRKLGYGEIGHKRASST